MGLYLSFFFLQGTFKTRQSKFEILFHVTISYSRASGKVIIAHQTDRTISGSVIIIITIIIISSADLTGDLPSDVTRQEDGWQTWSFSRYTDAYTMQRPLRRSLKLHATIIPARVRRREWSMNNFMEVYCRSETRSHDQKENKVFERYFYPHTNRPK